MRIFSVLVVFLLGLASEAHAARRIELPTISNHSVHGGKMSGMSSGSPVTNTCTTANMGLASSYPADQGVKYGLHHVELCSRTNRRFSKPS